jgi:2-keto-4-pentenoate hydratase/2-oxohepta-3-ene-1,7-dioic acid hydratase in catechol pathway
MRIASVTTQPGETVLAGSTGEDWYVLAAESDATALLSLAHRDLLERFTAGAPVVVEGPTLHAPLHPGKIIAAGLNYADHAREAGMVLPSQPLLFAKLPSSVVGPGHPIRFDPAVTERVDWEVELAVVIGQTVSNVSAAAALSAVFGYTVANDVSARDLQFGDGQWTRAKSIDSFCPLGPWIVTADEIPDPQALGLRTRVNGETVQDSTTAQMVFGVAELIAYCSRFFTLEPGDVILTGTPWGCGEFMTPQRSLQDGDRVEVEVDGIGTLSNPVMTSGAV